LDLGCGRGFLSEIIVRRGGQVIQLDIDINNLKYIKGTNICGDGRYLPFKDKVFDYTVSSDVLEHLHENDRERLISEMIRVSKERVLFTFSQVHSKNPLKPGICIFQSIFEFFKVPYPDWYGEHNKVSILQLKDVRKYISKFGVTYKVKAYQGILGLFFLSILNALTSSLLRISKGRRTCIALSYIISKTLDYLFYLILRVIDMTPWYSFEVMINIT
jgi:SAM-dependent methyltransferase